MRLNPPTPRGARAFLVGCCSLFITFIMCGCGFPEGGKPVATGGIIDLRKWDFAVHGPISLEGEWELCRGEGRKRMICERREERRVRVRQDSRSVEGAVYRRRTASRQGPGHVSPASLERGGYRGEGPGHPRRVHRLYATGQRRAGGRRERFGRFREKEGRLSFRPQQKGVVVSAPRGNKRDSVAGFQRSV